MQPPFAVDPVDSQTPMSFEQAMQRIEQIIDQLEDGQTGLEDSIRLYEQAVGLVRSCQGILEKAERRVSLLTRVDDQGRATFEPLDPEAPEGQTAKSPAAADTSESQPSGSQPSGSQPSGSQPSGSQASGSQASEQAATGSKNRRDARTAAGGRQGVGHSNREGRGNKVGRPKRKVDRRERATDGNDAPIDEAAHTDDTQDSDTRDSDTQDNDMDAYGRLF